LQKPDAALACISGVELLVIFVIFANSSKADPDLSREDYYAVAAAGSVSASPSKPVADLLPCCPASGKDHRHVVGLTTWLTMQDGGRSKERQRCMRVRWRVRDHRLDQGVVRVHCKDVQRVG